MSTGPVADMILSGWPANNANKAFEMAPDKMHSIVALNFIFKNCIEIQKKREEVSLPWDCLFFGQTVHQKPQESTELPSTYTVL